MGEFPRIPLAGRRLTRQSAGISLFYAGYMLTQLPGTLLLSKFKPRIMIPLMMFVFRSLYATPH